MSSGEEVTKKIVQKNAKVGLFSRIDYLSKGFRRAIIDMAFQIFRQETTHFNVLVGGLVSEKALKKRVTEFAQSGIRKDKANGKKSYPRFAHLLPREQTTARRKELQDQCLRHVAKELSQLIPVVSVPDPENPEKQKLVDLFIVTSPAFDGELGEVVAHLLSEIRHDIKVFNAGGDRLFVKYVDRVLWTIAPPKAVWMRGDYYSTAAERPIKDKVKQTTQGLPDIFAVGCFGSSIYKPKGELDYPYISIPAAHRIEETRVNENQIGVALLKFPSNHEDPPVFSTYNFKDMVATELDFISPPEGATEIQQKLVQIMKLRSWATPGMFRYFLEMDGINLSSEEIELELKQLLEKPAYRRKSEFWPGMTYQEQSKKYYFDLNWIQLNLRYSMPSGEWHRDGIMGFSCLHAGSTQTDYEFFINQVPERIIQHDIKILVNAGDTKEGYVFKDEIIGDMNNTKQEKFAANLIGTVIMKVFRHRFDLQMKDKDKSVLDTDALRKMIRDSLLKFYYTLGNHDLWETRNGHEPLETFHYVLTDLLNTMIEECLATHGLANLNFRDIIKDHITRCENFALESGLNVSIQHPHMSRALTTSLRPQQMLTFGKRQGCQVVLGGNFHVSAVVNEWDPDLGQRVVMQLGTIKQGSAFEDHKMKIVDQGVGCMQVLSKVCRVRRDGKMREELRIFATEAVFYGETKRRPPVDNLDIINKFVENLGIPPLADNRKREG